MNLSVELKEKLKKANNEFKSAYLGATAQRQPVHTVYWGAQYFNAHTVSEMGTQALAHLHQFAKDPEALAQILNIPKDPRIHSRIIEKLKTEAVEDLRIDFEDGYGTRPDAEEDAHAISCAREAAIAMKEKKLSPFFGIRIKPLNNENLERSLRTLDLFVSTLVSSTGGNLPTGFVITLPKITVAEQSALLADALRALEEKNNLTKGSLKFEFMIETPQGVIDRNGVSPIRSFYEAGAGRCTGVHFGTYDYTAGNSITAMYQTMANPICDFAKHVIQVSVAGTPLWISDGATNIVPMGDDPRSVHEAWRLSYKHIRHSLATGYYQGWDMHAHQLPVRYAAIYSFYLESLDQASMRLKAFVEKAAKATLTGDVFDDIATGQGLLNFFLRGMSSGAVLKSEALATGLTLEEFESRSFAKIIANRTAH